MKIDYSIWRPMPPELESQDRELHQKQLDALDRYDFGEALELSQQQTALRESWYEQCLQEHQNSSGSTGEGVSAAS